jgi:two-component system, OmpR family, sensor histidine kinase KdpD
MLVVALVISNLTASVRLQARVAAHRERRTAALYAMSRELAATRGLEHVIAVAVRHVSEVFECQAVILLPDDQGRIVYPKGKPLSGSLHGSDLAVAEWVYAHGVMAGPGTDTLPGADAIYLPLTTASGPAGVLVVLPADLHGALLPEQRHLLETFAGQVALAIERVKSALEAQAAQLKMERELLRNSLLSAISHDLRTPLAVIVGSSSSLLEGGRRMDDSAHRELLQTVFDEAERMSRVVNNILDMTRLESGAVKLDKQWIPLEEVVGSVLTRLKDRLRDHPVEVQLPPDLPLVPLDGVLIEQVLVNLLDNAIKYTLQGTPIEIATELTPEAVIMSVADYGPGFAPGDEERVFDKFYRARLEGAQGGVGLGLSICRAIVEAHGGRIWAKNRESSGAVFRFTLPVTGIPPTVEVEMESAVAS